MKFIRKTAWYGVPVTIAAIMAVAVLFTAPAQKAEADSALTVAAVAFTAPTMMARVTETWTVAFTLDGSNNDDLASGDKVIVTFPAGFQIPAVPTAVLTGNGWVGAGCATPTAATVGQVVTITSAGVCIFDDTNINGDLTIAGITNPDPAQFAAATMTVAIDAADADHDVAAVAAAALIDISSITLSRSSASIPADGASTVLITATSTAVTTAA
ncbi:MAG: hypothetical protein QGG89_14405, partial [Vicinamibacterales bacterium]|nr:hypothetical protein [Vicinamibacterales bacterium]